MRIKEPRKLKDVPTVYAEVARLGHVLGIVLVECAVDPAGRVVQTHVVRGNPLFDWAAVATVSSGSTLSPCRSAW